MPDEIVTRIARGAEALGAQQENKRLAPFRRRSAELATQQGEQNLQRGQVDLQQAQEGLKKSRHVNKLIEVASVPKGQRMPILQRQRQELLAEGEDVSALDRMIASDTDTRDALITQGIDFLEQQGVLKTPASASSGPSSVQEFQFFQGLTDAEKKTFMDIKRAQPGVTLAEIEGQKGAFDRGTGEFTAISTAEGERAAAAESVAATTTAKGEAEQDIKRAAVAPQRAEKARVTVGQIDGVVDTINEAIGLTGQGTAGFAALLDFIPQSGPRELGNAVQTIQANLGFSALQAMRDASPTGGALGQVSERELAFLQSTLTNLDTKQKPETLKKNLRKALTHYQNWRGAVINARGRDLMLDGMSEQEVLEQIRIEFPQ